MVSHLRVKIVADPHDRNLAQGGQGGPPTRAVEGLSVQAEDTALLYVQPANAMMLSEEEIG